MLWGHCRICVPSSTETSLCGTYLCMSICTYLYMFLYVRNSQVVLKLVITASSFVTATVPLCTVSGAVLLNFCVLNSICCGRMRCSQQQYYHHDLPDAIHHCVGAGF